MLEGRALSRRFGGLWAVKRVGFQVNEREILGIIGPNGAGKTTLFNIITGFLKPNEGRVIAFGEDVTGLLPHEICKKGIARTFQLTKPFASLSVLDNVVIGSILRSRSVDEAMKRATKILEFTGLSKKRDDLGKNLTIIEAKRLELTKALATEPKILLLDEVMAGLKPTEVDEILAIIRKLRDSGITIVIVEHVMRAIKAVCDRVLVLDHGKKIAEGIPKEIMSDEEVIRSYLGEEYRVA